MRLHAEFDYLIMKFELISAIFRLHRLSTVSCNFLKNVKTLEPKTYITILSIPSLGEISRDPFLRPCAAPHAVVMESRS